MGYRSFFLVAGACVLAVACSDSGTGGATFSSNTGGAGGSIGAGAASPTSSTTDGTTSSASSTTATTSTTSTSVTSTTSTGTMTMPCQAPNTCASPIELSSVDGDQNNDTRTVSGYTSKWFKILITDHQPTFGNSNESYTATLDVPAGSVYDLYAYPGDSSGPDCFTEPLVGTGTPRTISDQWPDGNSDDSRYVALEVRYISGTCDPTATWTLTVVGHTGS